MTLLHSFSDASGREPATYETLIEYLPARQAAGSRDGPTGNWRCWRRRSENSSMTPPATTSTRQPYREWKRLIPEGQLPKPAKGATAPTAGTNKVCSGVEREPNGAKKGVRTRDVRGPTLFRTGSYLRK